MAGFSPHHLDHSGTLSLPLALFQSLIAELVSGLFEAGFQRVAIVNGHGGNSAPLRAIITELQCQGYAVTLIDYWLPSRTIWPAHLMGGLKDIGHACEFETALQMFLRDEDMANQIVHAVKGLPAQMVQPYLAEDAVDNFSRFGAVAAPIFNHDHLGYYGDPSAATAETGALLFDIVTHGLAEFL